MYSSVSGRNTILYIDLPIVFCCIQNKFYVLGCEFEQSAKDAKKKMLF